jgi:hypothetical protein
MGKPLQPSELAIICTFIFALWASLLVTHVPAAPISSFAINESSLPIDTPSFLQTALTDTTEVGKNDTTSTQQAYSIKGTTGWHLITSPGRDAQFGEILTGLWSQGISGSDAPALTPDNANIYGWNEENGLFEPIKSMEDRMLQGRGYMMHVYADDNLNEEGIQGGFPKNIAPDTSAGEIRSPVMVSVRSIDQNGNGLIDRSEGFNLLANPFGEAISVDAIIDALRDVNSNVNEYAYVWGQNAGGGNGNYIPLAADGSGEQIEPYQAFFVRYTADEVQGEVSFDRDDLKPDDIDFERPSAGIEISLGNDRTFDTYQITFAENGTAEEDRTDAYKLFSLNEDAVSLFSTSGNDVKLAKKVLPPLLTIKGEMRIPMAYAASDAGEYSLNWSGLTDIPQSIELKLVDREANRSMDMRIADEYRFSVNKAEKKAEAAQNTGRRVPGIDSIVQAVDNGRFELLIRAANSQQAVQSDEVQENVVLSPNYPNPFTAQTTMDLALKENMHVKMTVWTIVGQKVGEMADQMMSEGDHFMTWNAPANMPSGIYLCKVEAGGKVITRKMTLVK